MMQGSENADIWRFERDQYRKQLSDAMLRIEELETGILEVAGELLPSMENGQNLMHGYGLLRKLAETTTKELPQ